VKPLEDKARAEPVRTAERSNARTRRRPCRGRAQGDRQLAVLAPVVGIRTHHVFLPFPLGFDLILLGIEIVERSIHDKNSAYP
jgi:hypothetical protein